MSFWTPTASTTTEGRFSVTATRAMCVGPEDVEFVMGGVAQAMAVDAAELATGKPLLWSTIQFNAAARNHQSIDIDVIGQSGGRSLSQVRVDVTADQKPVQSMFAALGARPGNTTQFIKMPTVDGPENCPRKDDPLIQTEGNLISEFDRRTALEDAEAGLEYMWIRPVKSMPITAGLLALTSDFMLGAHRDTRGGTSLDNTLRVFSVEPTDWILSVTQMSGFREGVAMGVTHQFTQDGRLLSTSSQTGLLPRK